MFSERPNIRLPRVPIWRRGLATFIDAVPVWMISFTFPERFSQLFLFMCLWLLLRVVLVIQNRGQSLGRWALDIKIVEIRFGKTPGYEELLKREGIIGLCAYLAIAGSTSIWAGYAAPLILTLPLLADCSTAFVDEELRQAFHDRIAGTVMVQTRRGYSLDLKVKKWLDQVNRFVRR